MSFIYSLVKAIEAFCLFPFPFFFNSFCLDTRTFLGFLKYNIIHELIPDFSTILILRPDFFTSSSNDRFNEDSGVAGTNITLE